MTKQDIEQYLNLGKDNSLCIDITLLDEYPGCVRELIISKDSILRVEFNTHGYDEGGLAYQITYDSLESLIKSTEYFLGTKVKNWENFNKTGRYPELLDTIDWEGASYKLKNDFITGKISLPANGLEYKIQGYYWETMSKYSIKDPTLSIYDIEKKIVETVVARQNNPDDEND